MREEVCIFGAIADVELGVELIERLRAVAGGEPELRGSDLDGKIDVIEAGVELLRSVRVPLSCRRG